MRSAFRRRANWVLLVVAALLAMSNDIVAADNATFNRETRATMDRVFESIAYLLPYSLHASRTGAPEKGEFTRAEIETLIESVGELVAHTKGAEKELHSLARSLEHRLYDVRFAFEEGEMHWMYFILSDVAEHCAACHSRLPNSEEYPLGQRLMARMDVDSLLPEELAALYVATRQFDMALRAFERILLDPGVSPVESDMSGTLLRYVKLCIAVRRDFDRLQQTLSKVLERSDLPYYLARAVEGWLADSAVIETAFAEKPTLELGQRLFERATEVTKVPAGNRRMALDLAAASVLRQFLDARSNADADAAAEAYYLLGVVALRTGNYYNPAVPEMELLLEAAIRSAPGGPRSKDAYALLEEFGIASGVPLLASDLENRLFDLDELARIAGVR